MDKNDYYHSFKIYLKSRPKIKFKSSARNVNLVDPKYFLKNNQIDPGSWLDKSSQSFLYFFNLDQSKSQVDPVLSQLTGSVLVL
jgi:hypothetical protein